jgi:hypothetical protein
VEIVAHPVNPRLFYAVLFEPSGFTARWGATTPPFQATLHRSTTGGRIWDDVTGPLARIEPGTGRLAISLPLDYPDRLYVAGDGGTWVFHDPAGACPNPACAGGR